MALQCCLGERPSAADLATVPAKQVKCAACVIFFASITLFRFRDTMHVSRRSIRNAGLFVERSAKQWRWLVRLSHAKRMRNQWMALDHGESQLGRQRCLFDLRRIACDGEQGRRFHALVSLLSRGGYEISIVPRLSFFQSAHKGFKQSALANVRPFLEQTSLSDPSLFDLCISDSSCPHPLAQRTLQLVSNTSRPVDSDELPVPYSLYPKIWDNGEDKHFAKYRSTKRAWRLFFGGHCGREAYTDMTYDRIKTVDRFTVLQMTQCHFADRVADIRSEEQLQVELSRENDSFVIINNDHFRTAPQHWLGMLARSEFFLAPPGSDYPISHNLIESLAVGTIPVLEYDSIMTPALQDGVNCIAYRGTEGLKEALHRVESMPMAEVAKLRNRVVEYYEQHLSPNAFCQKMRRADVTRLHQFSYLTPASEAV